MQDSRESNPEVRSALPGALTTLWTGTIKDAEFNKIIYPFHLPAEIEPMLHARVAGAVTWGCLVSPTLFTSLERGEGMMDAGAACMRCG